MPDHQSPVDIPAQAPLHRDGLELRYGPIPLVLGRHPSAIRVDCTCEAAAVIDETRYELDQFDIHCPGEHTFGGTHAPLAVHLVHRSAAGRLAVVAVLFQDGPANEALAALVSALDQGHPPATSRRRCERRCWRRCRRATNACWWWRCLTRTNWPRCRM